jgi:plasmid maintenance system antidote protein VapI
MMMRRINEIVLGKRAITADTELRLARYFGMSDGFFIGLQADYELMERKRAIGEKLKATGPRAAQPKISHPKYAELRLRDRRIERGRET